VLSLSLAAALLVPALHPEAGIPDVSALAGAQGRVARVMPERYGVKFRLHGRAETFDFPSKAGGYDAVESALLAAGTRDVSVLYDPNPRRPWFSSDVYYDVWQLTVDGKTVRTIAEAKTGWRKDNAVTPWLCAWFLLSGFYFSVSAVRTWRLREFK
jgi:hypothetical protein